MAKTKELTTKPAVAVNNVRSARRLLSRVISQYQKGEIDETYAKTIAYLLQVYVSLFKDAETEADKEKWKKIAAL